MGIIIRKTKIKSHHFESNISFFKYLFGASSDAHQSQFTREQFTLIAFTVQNITYKQSSVLPPENLSSNFYEFAHFVQGIMNKYGESSLNY